MRGRALRLLVYKIVTIVTRRAVSDAVACLSIIFQRAAAVTSARESHSSGRRDNGARRWERITFAPSMRRNDRRRDETEAASLGSRSAAKELFSNRPGSLGFRDGGSFYYFAGKRRTSPRPRTGILPSPRRHDIDFELAGYD